MRNFVFHNPTKIVFGEGTIPELGGLAKPYGAKALLIYGQGSIKRNGVYDQVVASLKESGVELGIITGRTSQVVAKRMDSLGIRHVFQGCSDKLPAFDELLGQLGLDASQTAYVGDDVVDLPVMGRAGLAVAVADAHPLVVRHSHWQTPHAGGRGAARDVCELIMEAQGNLESMYRKYLG